MSFFTAVEITDGTNIAAVKPASTAAIASDPAVVVATSPNNTTKVAGTGTAGTPNAGVVTIQGVTGMTPVSISGASGTFLDQVLGSAKRANSLQVGGNDGTNQYAIPLVSGGGAVITSIANGANTAAVKAASTAATATDPALVVTTNGSTTAGACANTSVTSTSSSILAANTARREAIIVNTDVVVIYIGLGQTPSATAYHIALKPCTVAHDGTGGSFVTDTWKGAINAIVASTTGHATITELT